MAVPAVVDFASGRLPVRGRPLLLTAAALAGSIWRVIFRYDSSRAHGRSGSPGAFGSAEGAASWQSTPLSSSPGCCGGCAQMPGSRRRNSGCCGRQPRTVSDLERGVNSTARKDTARLLADALGLAGPDRERFVAAARRRSPAGEPVALARLPGSGALAVTVPRGRPEDDGSWPGPPDMWNVPGRLATFTGRRAALDAIRRNLAGRARWP